MKRRNILVIFFAIFIIILLHYFGVTIWLDNKIRSLFNLSSSAVYNISTKYNNNLEFESTDELKKEYGSDSVIDINGARVKFDDGWFLVRASSNMPVLTLGFEAKTKERLEELQQILKKHLDKYPEISKEWKSG